MGPGRKSRCRQGDRRFVFEGFECGGHIGPRSSFVLWESQIETLLTHGSLDELSILFAGGIHDDRSAAMVATMAAPLSEAGAHIGVLLGTAYLFTTEAVACGAIGSAFQREALDCAQTRTLHSGVGQITRCANSPFVEVFESTRRGLAIEGRDEAATWAELETLNLGRLRVASKGLRHAGETLVAVSPEEQHAEGLFMMGDVATLRAETTTVAALHQQVTEGATAWVAEVERARLPKTTPAVADPAAQDVEQRTGV